MEKSSKIKKIKRKISKLMKRNRDLDKKNKSSFFNILRKNKMPHKIQKHTTESSINEKKEGYEKRKKRRQGMEYHE